MAFIPDPALRTVKLTVVVRSGRLELAAPLEDVTLREGCHGEVELPASAVLDEQALRYLTEERVIPLLPRKSTLLYRVRGLIDSAGFIKPRSTRHLGPFSYAELIPQEVVFLRLHGTKLPGLEPVPCEVPALKGRLANSINHACTLISETFETTRLSHTTNAFDSVFVEEENGRLVNLDQLRRDSEYLFEQRELLRRGSEQEPL